MTFSALVQRVNSIPIGRAGESRRLTMRDLEQIRMFQSKPNEALQIYEHTRQGEIGFPIVKMFSYYRSQRLDENSVVFFRNLRRIGQKLHPAVLNREHAILPVPTPCEGDNLSNDLI